MLQNEYLVVKIGVDTAENEPLKVLTSFSKIIQSCIILSLLAGAPCGQMPGTYAGRVSGELCSWASQIQIRFETPPRQLNSPRIAQQSWILQKKYRREASRRLY